MEHKRIDGQFLIFFFSFKLTFLLTPNNRLIDFHKFVYLKYSFVFILGLFRQILCNQSSHYTNVK